jgi:hypothetical protein
MKNLIIGLFSALLMTAGLVGVAQTSATAAGCGYTGTCPATHTHVTGPGRVVKGHRATFCVTVSTNGNGRPQGTVTLTIAKRNHAFRSTNSKTYSGHRVCFSTPRLDQVGAYTASAHFTGKRFKSSTGSKGFSVVKHH